jgi:hypothetical protein
MGVLEGREVDFFLFSTGAFLGWSRYPLSRGWMQPFDWLELASSCRFDCHWS